MLHPVPFGQLLMTSPNPIVTLSTGITGIEHKFPQNSSTWGGSPDDDLLTFSSLKAAIFLLEIEEEALELVWQPQQAGPSGGKAFTASQPPIGRIRCISD